MLRGKIVKKKQKTSRIAILVYVSVTETQKLLVALDTFTRIFHMRPNNGNVQRTIGVLQRIDCTIKFSNELSDRAI